MNLREILQRIADTKEPIVLCDSNDEWDAGVLLEKLTEPVLKLNAYMQPGMYIAEINQGGYLGRVLYRLKPKD